MRICRPRCANCCASDAPRKSLQDVVTCRSRVPTMTASCLCPDHIPRRGRTRVDEHPLLDLELDRAWGWVIGACLLTLWASCGYHFPRRRLSQGFRGHGPLEFDQYSTFDVLGVAAGLGLIAFWVPRLVSRQRRLRHVRRTQDARFFARAGAPRSIYELLLGVAASDGNVGQDEREVVTQLMTRELPERVLPQDLNNWATSLTSPRDPVLVARSLALLLTPDECRSVLRWCREVAAVDAGVDQDTDLLRRLGKVLGRKLVTIDTTPPDPLP